MAHVKFSGKLFIEDQDGGLLVQQGSEGYIARNWQITPSTVELINTAISSGLGCMIRDEHPRRNARLPNTRGVVYLAFPPLLQRNGRWQ